MRICIDSNCFSKLIDDATGDIFDDKNSIIKFPRERLEHFISTNRAEIVLPTPVLTELLWVSSIEKNYLMEYLANNAAFILAPYDQRASIIHADVELPNIRNKNKVAGRSDVTANRLKFDRQILSIAKRYSVDYMVTTDSGMVKDAIRYDVITKCISTMEFPPDIRQPSLSLVQPQVAT